MPWLLLRCLGALALGVGAASWDAPLSRRAWKARCGVDAASASAPGRGGGGRFKSVAVLLWGESFRSSRHRGDRSRCDRVGDKALLAQRGIRSMHYELFEALSRLGYGSEVFGATASCTERSSLDAAAVLTSWYRDKLGAPIVSLDRGPPQLNAAMRARVVPLLMLRAAASTHSHVLQLRWDLGAAAARFPACFLESGALLDSHALGGFGPSGDWDRAVLAPAGYVDAWTCLLESDAPRLDPRAACAPDGNTRNVSLGIPGATTTCVCDDPGFVGPDVGDSCWHRHCAWDVCLSACPSASGAGTGLPSLGHSGTNEFVRPHNDPAV